MDRRRVTSHKMWALLRSSETDVSKFLFLMPLFLLIASKCDMPKILDRSYETEKIITYDYRAVCYDGFKSLSRGPGTCSGHGGVQRYIPEEEQSQRVREMARALEEIEAIEKKALQERGYAGDRHF